jgi:hypothetical protein
MTAGLEVDWMPREQAAKARRVWFEFDPVI